MMDYLSSQPPPNTQEATQYIVDKLKTDYNDYGVSEDDLRFVVVDELNKFHSLGSLAAWYSMTSSLVIKNVRSSINKKFNLKN
jgi:hypothetical protein